MEGLTDRARCNCGGGGGAARIYNCMYFLFIFIIVYIIDALIDRVDRVNARSSHIALVCRLMDRARCRWGGLRMCVHNVIYFYILID